MRESQRQRDTDEQPFFPIYVCFYDESIECMCAIYVCVYVPVCVCVCVIH